jgi:DNA-binding PadR family transcriptional regulator
MIAKDAKSHGLWELALLALLREGPMHPYEMQRLLRERHKDELLVLKRGSLYHAINRLLSAKLIDVVETGRNGRRPERTTYRITDEGEKALAEWLRQMVAVPKSEASEFMAAMSFLVHLKPKDAIPLLEQRVQWLEKEIAEWDASMNSIVARVGRINLIEIEYQQAMRKAEAEWIHGLVAELRSGRFTWDLKKIIKEIQAAKRLRPAPKER